eukprot:CAMPEP_0174367200 /NCGR_PEP_ID=MMETSP0811_2-20130205/84365_1 /TAXON_ID=73025 ORGANISM="Eutreptiella gymnastica-like, Strain CCMP1594" /NCGR_SAMPLE_ID=MMETSP0811_2 /ASSEMBLY_ACC=CAM_ASM_000667 /LENGTH=41 /DNA_ID= /DNA_START= /DNA_END= /DNA_ORIENTATION=
MAGAEEWPKFAQMPPYWEPLMWQGEEGQLLQSSVPPQQATI